MSGDPRSGAAFSEFKLNAAADLVGHELPGGWRVVEQVTRRPDDTGGNFSICYLVEKDDEVGFCKVLNYEWLMRAQGGADPVEALRAATEVFTFERDLSRSCSGLSRVVTTLDDGSFHLDGYLYPLVSFIIFERGDADIRRLLNTSDELDLFGCLKAIHDLAAGVRQLHGRGIAHQDVKPSNALVFPTQRGSRATKVSDLGRASVRGQSAMHDDFDIAGDGNYAPIEPLYGSVPTSFEARRFACDMYQLGSMVCFIFTASHLNALLRLELHPNHAWQNCHGRYQENLPHIRDAFGRVLERIRKECPGHIADRVVSLVARMCDPDPERRGHPSDIRQGGNQYRLDRFVTELDLLAARSRFALSES